MAHWYFWQMCLALSIGFCLMTLVAAQEEFKNPIVCYDCLDTAENSTCGEPELPIEEGYLPTVECKRGACIKFTYYRNGVLMMQRTCSENMDLLIHLNQVCRTERNGNGYLCMCAKDQCNEAAAIYSSGYLYTLLLGGLTLKCLVHELHTRVF